MARLTGKAGAASLAAATVVLTGWELEVSSSNVTTTAAGDPSTDRAHLRNDWRATVRALLSVTPPYDVHLDLVGTEVALVLKILAADTNGIFSDTGLVESARINHPHDGGTELEVTVISSDGAALGTYDESPAS